MKTLLTPARVFFAATLVTGLTAVACGSSSSNPAPTGSSTSTSTGTIVGATSTSSSSTSGSSSSGTGGSTASTSTTSTSTSTGSSSGSCFSGTPTTNDEFLNACDPSETCTAFDKSRLTKLEADGGLPALP